MSPQRLPRRTALLVLPFLAGALLLMHGLDAGATMSGFHGAAGAVPLHSHQGEAPTDHRDASCDGCALGHVMAACVAIVATAVGLRVARRATGAVSTQVILATGRIRAGRQPLRPPGPVWVRLAVMRC